MIVNFPQFPPHILYNQAFRQKSLLKLKINITKY
jgi:hypothetical protein